MLPPVDTVATSQILQAVDASRQAAGAGADPHDAVEGYAAEEGWTVVGWLKGLGAVKILADALLRPVGSTSSAHGVGSRVQLGYVRALGRTSKEAFRELLGGDAQLVSRLGA